MFCIYWLFSVTASANHWGSTRVNHFSAAVSQPTLELPLQALGPSAFTAGEAAILASQGSPPLGPLAQAAIGEAAFMASQGSPGMRAKLFCASSQSVDNIIFSFFVSCFPLAVGFPEAILLALRKYFVASSTSSTLCTPRFCPPR